MTIVNFFVAINVSKLSKHFSNSFILSIGILITLIGMIFITLFSVNLGYWIGIAIPMILLGIGQGLSFSTLTVAGIANASDKDSGAASGVVNTAQQIGGSVGLSAVISISSLFTNHIYNIEMVITSIFLFISLLIAIFLIYPSERKYKIN